MVLAVDLLNPTPAAEARKHKLKTLVPAPRSFFMDVKCPGCFTITTEASERKDLENLVKTHWDDKVVHPYKNWDAQTIQSYLTLKGWQAKEGAKKDTNSLLEQVKLYWTETEESANNAYGNVRDWMINRQNGSRS